MARDRDDVNEDDFEDQGDEGDGFDEGGGVSEDDLEAFDADFDTEAKFPENIEVLEDGDYTFEIVKIDLRKAGDSPIFELTLLCEEDGDKYQYTYWLNRQMTFNILGRDLVTLGIDADEWERFSAGLLDLFKNRKDELVGQRFLAKKGTNKKGYATFFINAPIKAKAKPKTEEKPAGGKGTGGKGGGKGTGSTGSGGKGGGKRRPAREETNDDDDTDIPF